MKIIIAADSFKGSLCAAEAAEIIETGVRKVLPEAEVVKIPMADGGEGTVDAMVGCLGGHYEYCSVTGPMGEEIQAKFGNLSHGKAVIEMAAASGLTLVEAGRRDIMKATTYGTGQLIKRALDMGFEQIYIGIGGSATNDGGTGMAQALGAHFYNASGEEIGFGGGELSSIESIDLSEMDPRLLKTQIIVMSDVTNPLCGENGAAAVYGPQKGASTEQVAILDRGLFHLADLVKRFCHKDVMEMKGAGAAGGLGMGLVAFAGARLCPGIEAVMEAAEYEKHLVNCNLVITGEGRMDDQTVNGKVPAGVAACAAKSGVPTVAVAGCLGDGADILYHHSIASMESCVCAPVTLEQAMKNASDNLIRATERMMRFIVLGMNLKDKFDNSEK